MNTLFKKYFWAVKLAGVALLALVSAGVVNDVIVGKLFVLPSAKLEPAKGPAAPLDTEFGRVAEGINAARELSDRRIFKLEEPAPPPTEEPKVEAPVVAEAPRSSNELELSTLPINLVGTYVSTIPDYSYATLQIEGEAKVASTGSEYLDGKAKVIKIAPGHIVLKEDTRYTYVSIWKKNDKAAVPGAPGQPPGGQPGVGMNPPPIAPPAAEPVAGEAPAPGDDVASGVTKTGAYDYSVDRKMLDKQLADLSKLQQEARVVPHYKDNSYQGFKLVGVRPGSLYRALGIRSGDVITAVNGNKIDSPNKALELFEQLKSSNNISVEIERRGQPKTLGYTIQ